nr:L,D-transpeptidase [uncultured Moellerella sp.]
MMKKRMTTLRISIICSLLMLQYPAFSQTDSQVDAAAEKQLTTAEPIKTTKALVTQQDSLRQILAAFPQGVKPIFANQLSKIYADNQMQLMWQDETAIQQFQQQLAELALAGFQPQFGEWLVALENSQLNELGRDAVLSDAMLGYLQYLSGVEQNGQSWLYRQQAYKLAAPTQAQIAPWLKAVKEGHSSDWVKTLAPSHPLYLPMRQAMLTELSDTREWPTLTSTTTIKPNQSSDDVIALREILDRYGLLPPASAEPAAIDQQLGAIGQASEVTDTAIAATEAAMTTTEPLAVEAGEQLAKIYDAELVEAVKKFQLMFGLDADGAIGRGTKQWLNTSPRQKAGIMALNIQRLRIIPASNGTGILVNIPNYSLDFYLNNELILDSKVIVGRPDRKTPIMSSALNNVVINPPWSVPTSMTRKDIAPKGKQDPSYFSRRGYTIYSGWDQDSYEIDPYSIDWENISPANFPYRVRQAPGPSNSLGRYKFNMPSSDAIYLHDTPNHSLFNKNARAISSGCVRVNKADKLATILLGDAGWKQDRIDGAVKQGDTRFVNIPDRIPVYLYYQTAWVEDDQPQYRADIYQYDKVIETAVKYTPSIQKALK